MQFDSVVQGEILFCCMRELSQISSFVTRQITEKESYIFVVIIEYVNHTLKAYMGIFTRNVAKDSHQHQKLNFHEHKWFSLHMKAYRVEGI